MNDITTKRRNNRSPKDENPISEKRYQNDFLSHVIVRIDYKSSITINDDLIKDVRQVASVEFPIEEHNRTEIIIDNVIDATPQSRNKKEEEWIFSNHERDCSIELSSNCLLIHYIKYKSYKHLRNWFIRLSSLLYKNDENIQIQRLGLRYVDEIDLKNEKDPTNWKKYLNKKLLSIFDLADDKSKISRAFHSLILNYGEWNMHFQYGMHNPDYPAQIRRKIFVLDTDIYCELLLDKQQVTQWLDRFHEKAILFFEEVITNELRKKMGYKNGK